MAYAFYLDGVQLPVTPGKLRIKVGNQNKTLTLIDGTEINLLKSPGLSDVQFDALLPQVHYPFATGSQTAEYYLGTLKRLKTSKQPFQFIVSRMTPGGKLLFDTNMKVSLEDYQIEEDANTNGLDLLCSIKLKQYADYGTKTILVKEKKATVKAQRSTTTAPAPKTYTVKKGDTLWAISKKCLGNGGRYPEIYALNKDKIKNPNIIHAGQVLTLP